MRPQPDGCVKVVAPTPCSSHPHRLFFVNLQLGESPGGPSLSGEDAGSSLLGVRNPRDQLCQETEVAGHN